MNHSVLLCRIRLLTWIFIIGLVLSGVTAIPLQTEVSQMVKVMGLENATASNSIVAQWLLKIRDALNDTAVRNPFLF